MACLSGVRIPPPLPKMKLLREPLTYTLTLVRNEDNFDTTYYRLQREELVSAQENVSLIGTGTGDKLGYKN